MRHRGGAGHGTASEQGQREVRRREGPRSAVRQGWASWWLRPALPRSPKRTVPQARTPHVPLAVPEGPPASSLLPGSWASQAQLPRPPLHLVAWGCSLRNCVTPSVLVLCVTKQPAPFEDAESILGQLAARAPGGPAGRWGPARGAAYAPSSCYGGRESGSARENSCRAWVHEGRKQTLCSRGLSPPKPAPHAPACPVLSGSSGAIRVRSQLPHWLHTQAS